MPAFQNACFIFSAFALTVSPTVDAAAQGFLAPDLVSRERVIDQLRMLLGHGQNRARLFSVEDLLRPTYMALPKDSIGGLDHKAARYALYRYFLVHHGWHIKGLTMDSQEMTSSVSTIMSKASMPAFIMELLEQHVGHRVALEELAVLAATIEDLVHSDAVDLVQMAYKTHDLSTEEPLTEGEADLVIRTFALFFLLPTTQMFSDNATKIIALANGQARKAYPGWKDAMLWLEDVKLNFEFEDRVALRPFASVRGGNLPFSSIARWATALSSGFGRFGDVECKEMKNKLLDLDDEEKDDGRVRLDKFYGPFLSGGSFHFSESPEYLRHLGALDEANPRRPSVIVPNILYSKSNCMATSGFHSVCCIDHCEVLMSDLEQRVAQPMASAQVIASAVASIPSETVAAPRNLSSQMLTRLDEIASRHGGSVPLHSRLFAQWMHYAFPNECPFPRSLLTSEKQLTSREWSEAKKKANAKHNVMATQEEMKIVVDTVLRSDEGGEAEGSAILWSEDEELLSDVLVTSPARGMLSSCLRWVAGAAVLVASLRAMADAARATRGDADKKEKGEPWFGKLSTAAESRAHFV